MPRKKKNEDLTWIASKSLWTTTATRDGKRKQFYSNDPDECRAKKEAWLSEGQGPLLFATVANAWRDAHFPEITPGARTGYNSAVDRAIAEAGGSTLEEVGAAEINAVLLRMKAQDFSGKSIKNQRTVYNLIFKYAIVQRYTTYNPVTAVTLPTGTKKTEREAPEDEAIEKIKASVHCTFGLFPYLLLYTGLRKGEALALTWEDIDFQAKTITINKAVGYSGGMPYLKTPKTKAGNRTVPLLSDLERELLPLRSTGKLFPQENGDYLSENTYERRWRHYCKDAGFALYEDRTVSNGPRYGTTYTRSCYAGCTLTAHQLRHGYATLLFEAGVPDQLAKELLGHSDITVTRQVYTHIREKKRNTAATLLEDYLSK